ncbi:hypothetical protein AC1031_020086 [Aphanomyces cochlioides]|nr:hypothetical protein AC1031_020086 [Aphanomyces cochlioides]
MRLTEAALSDLFLGNGPNTTEPSTTTFAEVYKDVADVKAVVHAFLEKETQTALNVRVSANEFKDFLPEDESVTMNYTCGLDSSCRKSWRTIHCGEYASIKRITLATSGGFMRSIWHRLNACSSDDSGLGLARPSLACTKSATPSGLTTLSTWGDSTSLELSRVNDLVFPTDHERMVASYRGLFHTEKSSTRSTSDDLDSR